MSTTPFSPDHIQISYCGIIAFQVQNKEEAPLRPSDIESHTFQIHVTLGVAPGNWLRVLLKADCKANPKSQSHETLSGHITTECFFNVEGLDDLLAKDEKESVPQAVALTAVSIAYSTTRGLLASRASGTVLEGAVLPIVQPVKLLTQEHEALVAKKFNFQD